ncbi:MAG: Nramp family divalent metal transporter [Bacteroidota bacterium]
MTTSTPSSSSIQEPPVRLRDQLKYLGPGFILSASIVGSGELIATTVLGAQAGFITFWVILVSCLVKVTVQLEFGKHAIYSGETVMEAFNRLPGPNLGQANWSIWAWLVMMLTKFMQVGGIVGGVAIALHIAIGGLPEWVWVILVAASVSVLVFRGSYRFIEGVSLLLIGLFSLLTLVCVAALQFTPYSLEWAEVASGLTFSLPPEALLVAIGAFGLTGVGGDEIMFYNYWCLEKGYATYVGPHEQTEDWNRRAKGWIKVMYLDAILAMVVYTVVTAAFYLLGAAVLHGRQTIPEGYDMIEILSTMYTETLGPWARVVFLIGAVVVLFSTLFGALASWMRIFADAFDKIGWVDLSNPATQKRVLATLAWLFPAIWGALFLFIQLPVYMVMIGGLSTSLILFLVVYVALHFRYQRLPTALTPGRGYDLAFWISVISIVMVGVYGLSKL